MTTILLIDDDRELGQLLSELLQYEDMSLECEYDGQHGLERLKNDTFDLVLLDVMLPGMSGIDVLKQVRHFSQIPILMLTARGDPVDRVLGLEFGADDYLPKPFTDAELVARIRAILRRVRAPVLTSEVLRSGHLVCYPGRQLVEVNDEPLPLTATECQLLGLLMRRAGDVTSKEQLSQDVLGRELSAYDRSLDMHISHLRRKLQEKADMQPIKTIRGRGYQWCEPVS